MRHFIAVSLLAGLGLTATQAQAGTMAPRDVFVKACKAVKGQGPDEGPQVVAAKPTVRAMVQVIDGVDCDQMVKSAATMTSIDLSGKELVDLSPLAVMNGLTELNISDNKVRDLSPLAGLTKLTKLNAAQNEISDISTVAKLVELDTLNLSKNSVTDIAAIADLPKLTTLRLDNNQIDKAFAVSNVKTLTSVNLNNNKIDNLTPLAKNKKLTDLKVKGNPVKTCPDGKTAEVKGKEIDNTDLLRGICKDEAYK
jgi:hypothetical protein